MTDLHGGAESALHPARLFSCAEQVAIVTGGSSGIGRASAEALAGAFVTGQNIVIDGGTFIAD